MQWTSVKLANRTARKFEFEKADKTRLHRVYRNFVSKGVLPTNLDEDDQRGTLVFDDNAAAVAILLLPMADMSIDVRGLREVAAILLSPSELDDGKRPIEHLIVAAKYNDESAYVETRVAWHAGTAQISRQTFVHTEKTKATGKTAEILSDYQAAYSEELAVLKIPSTRLLRKILELGSE